jgi:hypothetical protein
VKLAICTPVTKPTDAPAGSPSSSVSQPPTTCSVTAAAGPRTCRPAFWSQAAVSQSAASAAGFAPPTTNPKYRPLGEATRPGAAAATRAATTLAGSSGPSGSGPPRVVCSSSRLAPAATGRSGSPVRCASALSYAAASGPAQSGCSTSSASSGVVHLVLMLPAG